MKKNKIFIPVFCAFFLFSLLCARASAAVLTVTKIEDTNGVCNSGVNCSLREAIAAAAPGDVIQFSAVFNSAQTIALGGTELLINKNLTINGAGANLLTIDAQNNSRVFNVAAGATVILNDLRITRGAANTGGGVFNAGNLTVNNCIVSASKTPFADNMAGGGIYNQTGATLTVTNTTVSSNESFTGGGIFNNVNATLIVRASTFRSNKVSGAGLHSGGGGVGNFGAATIENSTFSGNVDNFTGEGAAAVLNKSLVYPPTTNSMTMTNCTVAENSGYYNGGIKNAYGVFSIRNTIVANNTASFPNFGTPDVSGEFVSLGNNIIRSSANSSSGWIASDVLNTDPQLSALGDYGGPTQTYYLAAQSPAINRAGISVFPPTDQRGVARPQGSAPDSGAVEYSNLEVLPNALPAIDALAPFSQQLSVQGAQVSSYALASGALPAGLTLTSGGFLSGTPTVKGTFNFTVTAYNSNNSPVASTTYNLIVNGLNNIVVTTNATAGIGSLPVAVGVINANGTITFDASLSGQTLNRTGGEMTIAANVTIDASLLANGFTVSAGNQSRVFSIPAGVTATFKNLKLRDGSAGANSGGAILNFGTLNLINCTISNSVAALGFGGGIANGGDLNVTGSIVSDNFSGNHGGGISSSAGNTVTIVNSLISNNQSTYGDGGGLAALGAGTALITNSTFSGNKAHGGGGAIRSDGVLSFSSSTASGNTAPILGGGLYCFAGTMYIINSTVSGNTSNSDNGFGGGVYSAGTISVVNSTIVFNTAHSGGGIHHLPNFSSNIYNSIVAGNYPANRSDVWTANSALQAKNTLFGKLDGTETISSGFGNLRGTIAQPLNPQLGALANNGGATATHALSFTSPAINAGNNALAVDTYNFINQPLTIDQRGAARIFDGTVDMGAVEVAFKVVNANDGGAGSLRDIVANAPANYAIPFDAAFFSVPRTINLTSGEIVINKNLTLNAPAGLTLDAGLNSRIFNVLAGATFNLNGGTLSRGKAPANFAAGGAILNFGTLNLSNANITASQATTGGGIANGATMNISNSAIYGNTASDSGGISNGGNNGTTTVTNSTISGNTATGGGGGGLNNYNGTLDLTNVTVAFNTAAGAGGGIVSQSGGTVRLRNSLIANNAANAQGADVSGAFASQGYNLVRVLNPADATGFGANDIVGASANPVSAALRPLASNGGATFSHGLAAGNAAINAADPQNFPATDQRGTSRPRGGRADIGAFELATFVSNTNLSGAESLPDVLANAADGDTILFDPSFFNVPRIINLAGGTLTIDKAITIQGPGANLLTISGNNQNRVFTIAPNLLPGVTISNVAITQGGQVQRGGGIYTSSTLNLNNVVVTGNSASVLGGGILSDYASINLNNCTISDNTTAFGGGGVYVVNNGSQIPGTGTLNIRNSTFSGNNAGAGGGAGGAIHNQQGATQISNSTFSGNLAPSGVGGAVFQTGAEPLKIVNSTFTLNTSSGGAAIYGNSASNPGNFINNSIVAANIGSGDISGLNGAHNLIGNGDGTNFQNGINGNIVGTAANPVNPLVGALANNGGATATHALQTGSPALNAGNDALAVDPETNQPLTSDQRGLNRFDNAVDIGAVERYAMALLQTTLPNGFRSAPYNFTLQATGGVAPYSFAVTSGALPNGLTLSANGLLSGTPTQNGTFNFAVTITDSNPGSNFTPGAASTQNLQLLILAPTAASVSVSGRVLTPDGRGLRNARVALTDASGETRTVLTGAFGNYRFEDVRAGETYVVTVRSKRHQFAPRVLTVSEETSGVDFIAEPE